MTPCNHPEDRATRLFAARDYVTGEQFEVSRCGACGLARTSPPPAQLAAYYPTEYYGTPGARRFPAPVELLQRWLYAGRARAVERIAGAPGRVLDVGCGRGFLLDAFRRRGWQVHGTELDERSAAHARDVLRIPVHVGPPASEPWPDGHFDAVVLWHVLEHLPDPAALLVRARRLLSTRGVLVIGVPDFGSPEARLTRDRWFHLDVPRHLTHLDAAWLGSALEETGFEVRRRSWFAPEFDCFSLVQSMENRLGLPHNLLYDLLRGKTAKLRVGTAGPLKSAAALLLAAPLGLVGLPATVLLSGVRKGSSVTFFAVKRA